MIYLKRLFFKAIGMSPDRMDMVQYWKTKTAVQAKVTKAPDGSIIMQMDGEKYPFPGFPRGHVLFGKLSKLKHEIKNQVFNDSWYALERGETEQDVMERINGVSNNIFTLFEGSKYDLVPVTRMCAPVREIHRAWTKVATSRKSLIWRDIFCHIIQEDDAYRFRVQWVAQFFHPHWWGNNAKRLEKAMQFMEHAEVIGDMKERQRLWRRIFLLIYRNVPEFDAIVREINWKKVKMSEADKFFFRGKWFKVDFDKFDY